MASPYALDFSPVTNALAGYRRGVDEAYEGETGRLIGAELARNNLEGARAIAAARGNVEGNLALAKFGREQELFPLQKRQLTSQTETSEEALRQAREIHPYQVRTAKTTAETGEETLGATRALRSDLGTAAATPSAARTPGMSAPTQQPAAPVVTPERRAQAAKRFADAVQTHVLDQSDPVTAQRNAEALAAHPELGAHFRAGGYDFAGDWRGAAQRFVQDMRQQAGPAVPTAADVAALAPRVASVAQTAEGPVAGDANQQPLFNLAREYQIAKRMVASGVPAFVTAGETHMKLIQSMMEKGQQLTAGGAVMPITGAAETQSRAEQLKQQAQKVGEGIGTAKVNLPVAINSAEVMVRNIDNLLKSDNLGDVTGVTMGHPWTPTIRQGSADTEALMKQVQGGVFMQAFQTLKGAGAISDVEGGKAALSIARLNETRQSEPAYRAALQEARQDVLDLIDLAKAKAEGRLPPPRAQAAPTQPLTTAPSQALPRIQGDADYNALPSGTRYIDPTGAVRTKR